MSWSCSSFAISARRRPSRPVSTTARGEIIIPLDADLQNDPADIPQILDKLDEGYDVVSCWRKDRQDPWLTRILPSRAANRIISWISGVRLRDYGCTLKGYRSEFLQHIRLYGEMHRFIPVYASWTGAKVTRDPGPPSPPAGTDDPSTASCGPSRFLWT